MTWIFIWPKSSGNGTLFASVHHEVIGAKIQDESILPAGSFAGSLATARFASIL
jgi:hypothetical protein